MIIIYGHCFNIEMRTLAPVCGVRERLIKCPAISKKKTMCVLPYAFVLTLTPSQGESRCVSIANADTEAILYKHSLREC